MINVEKLCHAHSMARTLLNPNTVIVFQTLEEEGPTPVVELSRLCGLTQPETSVILKNLRYYNLVRRKHQGKFTRYWVNKSKVVRINKALENFFTPKEVLV